MGERYKFLEETATADIAFEAYGKDEEELLENAALAVCDTSADLSKIKGEKKKEVELDAKDFESLVYDFLEEIVFLKDAEYMIFNKVDVKIKKENGYHLFAKLTGDTIDIDKHDLKNDVKAVTMHQFKVEKTDKGWKAFVILDV